jgi:hypothetical protein
MSSGSNFRFDSFHALSASMSNDYRAPAGSKDQRWSTFLGNHAHQMVACDFFVSFTACLRLFYVFVALESGWARLSGLFALHTSLMLISFHSSRLG